MSIAGIDLAASPGGLAAVSREAVGRSRRLAWSHPEWWALGLALAAWAVLIGADASGSGGAAAHVHSAGGVGLSVLAGTLHWQLMVMAMMLPVVAPSLRVTAFRSLKRRRHRAVAGFLAGYLAIWALPGLAVCTLLAWAPELTHTWRREAAAAAFLAAAAWQWSRIKQRALVACHRTMPLAPSGMKADRDCLAFGWRIGWSCCLSCWALMVACTLTGHSTAALLACGALGLAERYAWRPSTKLISLGSVALAFVFGPVVGLG